MTVDLADAIGAAGGAALVAMLGELRARSAARTAQMERAEERRIRLALLAQNREEDVRRLAQALEIERRRGDEVVAVPARAPEAPQAAQTLS